MVATFGLLSLSLPPWNFPMGLSKYGFLEVFLLSLPFGLMYLLWPLCFLQKFPFRKKRKEEKFVKENAELNSIWYKKV